MPRRRAGTLVPLELEILRAGSRVTAEGERFHGFGLAEALQRDGRRGLIAHGTLYKALARLQASGLLTAMWEEPHLAERAGRPRRKLYALTAAGEAALQVAERPAPVFRAEPLRGGL